MIAAEHPLPGMAANDFASSGGTDRPLARPLDGDPGASLGRFRVLAFAAPILVLAILELVRVLTDGSQSLVSRIILDALVAGAVVLFGFVMVRAISQAQRRLERQNEELLALYGAALDVTAELSLNAVLNKIVERARALMGAQRGMLLVVGPGGQVESLLTSGMTAEQRTELVAISNDLGVADTGSLWRETGHPSTRARLSVPIICESPFVGNLHLFEKEGGGGFTSGDQETLERFALQAAIAIDNASLHERVATLAVAEERVRIAHEMHDGIAQVLGYVNTKVQAASEYLRRGQPDAATVQLRELATAAREAYGDIREAIVDLRTLPDPQRSFVAVLEEYLDRWKEQVGISTQVTMDSNLTLPAATELQLVRIIQESMTNVRKHSRAESVRLDLRTRRGTLQLVIEDDGVGFNPEARARGEFPRFGLSTMRERAEGIGGTFTLTSEPGRGTRVVAEIPVTGPSARAAYTSVRAHPDR